jgi:hypothetical protein
MSNFQKTSAISSFSGLSGGNRTWRQTARQWVMTHKYRGSQQSSREVKPKFIDFTQGEPKNIYKP